MKDSRDQEQGIPWIWVTGGALATVLLMILALFGIVAAQGTYALWPKPIVLLPQENLLGTPYRTVLTSREKDAEVQTLLYLGNKDFGSEEFVYINQDLLTGAPTPENIWYVQRLEWGDFIGTIPALISHDKTTEKPTPSQIQNFIDEGQDRHDDIKALEKKTISPLNARLENFRLEERGLYREALNKRGDDDAYQRKLENIKTKIADIQLEFDKANAKVQDLRAQNELYQITLRSRDGATKSIAASNIVRAYQPNQLGIFGKILVFLDRVWEFLTEEPREANTAGGIFPALFGTAIMTLIMTIAVLPFGVLAAVYMREIAKQGPLVSLVRIGVGNLAGVPSIVYGVFGLGFFCYTMGVSIDQLFFSERLPSPTFGTGGILWASLTLALLTVPVVIVSTEEALSAVPRTLREASYGCGATRLQTIARIVIPKAMPGIMTGLILAMARGVGEVAPLLMTGVVKLAPDLPIDTIFPYVHLQRSFMHLGFHIYDLGFQSRSAEASRPMVFASTLLLIGLVLVLNFTAIKVRSYMRRKYEGRGAF